MIHCARPTLLPPCIVQPIEPSTVEFHLCIVQFLGKGYLAGRLHFTAAEFTAIDDTQNELQNFPVRWSVCHSV